MKPLSYIIGIIVISLSSCVGVKQIPFSSDNWRVNEANGHGALYILNGYNHRGASHHFRGTKDTNIKLIDMIIKSKTETVKNMK